MGIVRNSWATPGMLAKGKVYDFPLHSNVLLDDIEKVIIIKEGVQLPEEYWNYIIRPYPMTHYQED